jgi:Ca2+-binding EF-hand superfamily protein
VTFKCFDKDNSNSISKSEFIEFLENSWKAAFVNLQEKAKLYP